MRVEPVGTRVDRVRTSYMWVEQAGTSAVKAETRMKLAGTSVEHTGTRVEQDTD